MKKYIIDGNNLIGKIASLHILQGKNKQASREKLAYLMERFFIDKKFDVSLHFDGYQNSLIKISKVKIIYSNNRSADEEIKDEIERTKNRRNIIVVTSDNNLREFARACYCESILSEEFRKELRKEKTVNEEEKLIEEINDVEEFKRLFNVKNEKK